MKKDKKKIVIIIALLVGIITTYGITKIFIDKKEKLIINEVKNNKRMAIMVQSGDGYKEYVSKDDTWPGIEYVFKKAECVDNAGNRVEDIVTFDNETRKATVKSKKTVYCTLYFDEKPKLNLSAFCEKYSNLEECIGTEKNNIENVINLSPNLQGNMYRYQGVFPDSDSSEMPNWICFGTTDNCGTNEDDIDKYMYRIIGITEEGQLYLLKETFLKEEETTNTFQWHNEYFISNCLGNTCEWPNVDLYKRLNGIGDTIGKSNIFVNSTQYDYLKSEDNAGVSGSDDASEWYQLIADHNWMYGDTNEAKYNGDAMYAIETGKTTKRYWPDEEQGQTTCSTSSLCTEKPYIWSKSAKNTKIGLMYMHDVAYAYYDGNDPDTRGNPGSATNVKNSWIHFKKDGYNSSSNYEWLSTRFGVVSESYENIRARIVNIYGDIGNLPLNYSNGVRPVFYLSSKLKITDGDGTKENPFILSLN